MPENFFPAASFGRMYKEPLRFEGDIYECEVKGEIPKELDGAYYRAGPDREFPTLEDDIIINGDGVISMFKFEDGHVSFRNRYVQTERLLTERAARKRLYGKYRNKYTDDPSTAGTDRDNTANTYAFFHSGRLFALREDSHPHQIDPHTLDTLPPWNFDGKLKSTSMTAHPKIDPVTGEWWSFGLFAFGEPTEDMMLHVIDKDGELIRQEAFKTPYPGLSHDFAVTREHVVFPIMPLTADIDRIKAGGSFYAFDSDLPSAWGIMPRNGTVEDIRWFNIPNLMSGHIMNAYTEGNMVHVDCTISPGNAFWFFPKKDGSETTQEESQTVIARISFDMSKNDTDAWTVTPFEGAKGEMPRFDERFAMSKYRIGYFAYRDFPRMGIGQLDLETGELKQHLFEHSAAQEPVFVPRAPDAPEGDGFVLSVVNRMRDNRSDLVILDGNDISREPIATVRLPFNQPIAFHGCFAKAAEIPNW